MPPFSPDAKDERNNPVMGATLLSFGLGIFMLQDVMFRIMSSDYSLFQLMFMRACFALIPLGILAWRLNGTLSVWSELSKTEASLLFLRGVIGFSCFTLYYLGLAAIPLPVVLTIFFMGPLMITILAALFLKETVGIRRLFAVSVGFLGVLIVVNPTGADWSLTMLFPIGAAATYAVMTLLTRRLGATISATVLAFNQMLTFGTCAAIAGLIVGSGKFLPEGAHESTQFMLREWTMLAPSGWMMVIACAVIATIGFLCLARAYKIAPASAIAPFEYTALPIGILLSWAVWNDLPDQRTILGGILIIGAGLFVIYRETKMRQRVVKGRPFRPRI